MLSQKETVKILQKLICVLSKCHEIAATVVDTSAPSDQRPWDPNTCLKGSFCICCCPQNGQTRRAADIVQTRTYTFEENAGHWSDKVNDHADYHSLRALEGE